MSKNSLMVAILIGLFPAAEALSGTLVIDSQRQWQEWGFPDGILELAADGSVEMRRFRRDINAVADAAEFVHKNAAGDDVAGGIRKAGTSEAQAANILDGDPTTWWQPDEAAPLDKWQIEIDLGRLVQARKIRLVFPDTTGARPLQDFSVFVSEGTRQVIGQDVFQFTRVGGTTLPNHSTVVEYDLSTVEAGDATGEHLVTVVDDTLEYMPVQYVHIAALSKNPKAALADVEVEAIGDNIALDTIRRGGSVRTGQDVQNISAIVDGSAAKWWAVYGASGVDWQEAGTWFEWDLGATFWVDQLNILEPPFGFATTGYQNSQQLSFELFTTDGRRIPTRGDETVQSSFDYELLSSVDNSSGGGRDGRNLHFDFRFPPRQVRHIFYKHQTPRTGNFWYTYFLFEIFLYSEGYPAEVVMTSNFIDLQDTKSLRALRWAADTPPGTSVEIRSRSGDSIDEEVFYYSKNGELIPQKLWEKLPASQKLPLVHIPKAGSDWSPWSSVYKLSGEAFLSPTPRRIIQLEVRLKTEVPRVAPSLRSIAIDFDDPLVGGGIFAEVLPREAALDSLIEFRLRLGGLIASGDTGFDQVRTLLPAPLEGEVQLRVGNRLRVPEQVAIEDGVVVVTLPELVRQDSVELVLPLRLTASASSFNSWVSVSAQPGVRQGIQPVEPGALTVFVPEIALGGSLIRKVELNTVVLTPNGDGVNDVLEVELLVVKTSRAPAVAIYDLSGRVVARLQGEAGSRYTWDGRSARGERLPPAIYILDVKVEADVRTERRQHVVNIVY